MGRAVLVVTANPSVAERARQGLVGFDVIVQENLVGLYAALVKHGTAAVVVDADFPRMALETAIKFVRQKTTSSGVPVVLYTSPPTGDDDDPALLVQATGATAFVEKSADPASLRRTLRTLLPPDAYEPTATATHKLSNLASTSGEGASVERRAMVLVVDDDPEIARLLEKVLQSRYDVVTVFDGESAVAACKDKPIDAVFCDVRMPAMNGADVYRAATATNEKLATRFVFVTAYQEDIERSLLADVSDRIVIKKPFSMREVLAAASRVLAAA